MENWCIYLTKQTVQHEVNRWDLPKINVVLCNRLTTVFIR
jgi:hypothetical protein